jgi:predicted DNA-binding transcriptional regulator AlpA
VARTNKSSNRPKPTPQQISPIVTLPPDGESYLNQPTIMAVFQIRSPVTLWRWVKDGKFPPPIRIAGSMRWELSALRTHIQKIREV